MMSATRPMTMTEKIIARHAGMPSVTAGDLVDVTVDLVMANDVTAPIAIREFKKTGLAHTFDPKKVVMVPSHFAPAKDLFAARNCEIMRTFALEEGLRLLRDRARRHRACRFAGAGLLPPR